MNGWQLCSYWQAIRAAGAAGIPVLVRGDSQLESACRPGRGILKRLRCYPSMLRSFDACLAVGRRNADYYRHYGVPETRIYRSAHCVDNDFFARAAAGTRRRRREVRARAGNSSRCRGVHVRRQVDREGAAAARFPRSTPADLPEAYRGVGPHCRRWSDESGGRRLPAHARDPLRDGRFSEPATHRRHIRGGGCAGPAPRHRAKHGDWS